MATPEPKWNMSDTGSRTWEEGPGRGEEGGGREEGGGGGKLWKSGLSSKICRDGDGWRGCQKKDVVLSLYECVKRR